MTRPEGEAFDRAEAALPDSQLAIFEQEGLQAVLLEDGKPVEWLRETAQDQPQRLDIYLGRVSRIVPTLAAVFVDIGTDRPGFLPVKQAPAQVKAGQPLLVQLRRLTADDKGHQLTTQIQLPGPFAVWRQNSRPIRRSKLKQWLQASQDSLFSHDMDRLNRLWQATEKAASSGPCPRLLLRPGSLIDQALSNLVSARTRSILVQGAQLFEQVDARIVELMPIYRSRLQIHADEKAYSLAAVLRIADLEQQLSHRHVRLKSGGTLVIDPVEALTVIDVNSHRDNRGRTPGDLHKRTNLEAAAEIARQIRLRNLNGMIIIDFIKMQSEADHEEVAAHLAAACRHDRARIRLAGFTRLGLFELIRSPL